MAIEGLDSPSRRRDDNIETREQTQPRFLSFHHIAIASLVAGQCITIIPTPIIIWSRTVDGYLTAHTPTSTHQHTHATLASQYLYSATSTHHLPFRPQDQHQRRLGFSKQALRRSPIERMRRCSPALNGRIYQPATQWNLNRQPCNGSPMQVDGRGDSLPFFPSFPSTNMSHCTNHTAGESQHLVIESLA